MCNITKYCIPSAFNTQWMDIIIGSGLIYGVLNTYLKSFCIKAKLIFRMLFLLYIGSHFQMGDKWAQKTKILIYQLSMCAPNNIRSLVYTCTASSIFHLAWTDAFDLDKRERSCYPRSRSIRERPKNVGRPMLWIQQYYCVENTGIGSWVLCKKANTTKWQRKEAKLTATHVGVKECDHRLVSNLFFLGISLFFKRMNLFQ